VASAGGRFDPLERIYNFSLCELMTFSSAEDAVQL